MRCHPSACDTSPLHLAILCEQGQPGGLAAAGRPTALVSSPLLAQLAPAIEACAQPAAAPPTPEGAAPGRPPTVAAVQPPPTPELARPPPLPPAIESVPAPELAPPVPENATGRPPVSAGLPAAVPPVLALVPAAEQGTVPAAATLGLPAAEQAGQPPMAETQGCQFLVTRGLTLGRVSVNTGLSVDAILAANPSIPPNGKCGGACAWHLAGWRSANGISPVAALWLTQIWQPPSL